MKHIRLFASQDSFCNPSIIEWGSGLVGIVKRWDFDSAPYFEGSIFFFYLNSDLQLSQLNFLPSLYGLRDYSLFSRLHIPYALLYHLNEVFLFRIGSTDARLISSLPVKVPKRQRDRLYSNKNFSPIQFPDRCFFIYSLNPYILMLYEPEHGLRFFFSTKQSLDLPYPVHGGTRFIDFNDSEKIGLFHAYTGAKARLYKTFLISLSNRYPFLPLRVSSEPILDAVDLFDEEPSVSPWLSPPSYVVYERGIARLSNDFIISYGVHDKSSYLLRASYKELDSMLDRNVSFPDSKRNIGEDLIA